jgi:heme-degrading monooxygenase HmoA
MQREPVVLINAFEVPEGEDDAFLRGWDRTREFLSTQDGYLSTRLHRSLAPGADFRFVNVALWESETGTSSDRFSVGEGVPGGQPLPLICRHFGPSRLIT